MQRLIGRMARLYPWLIGMGFLVVAIAFAVGYFNSQTAAAYFSQPKEVREASLLAERAAFESTGLWLPSFKFLGIGLILGGIVMALRVIIENLQNAGREALTSLPQEHRPSPPSPPWYGLLMPLVMVLGEALLVGALIVGLDLAATARSVFANPIPALDAASAGSRLLTQLQSIHSASAWLVPLKFFGVATEFLAIVMGLTTIVFILSRQTRLLNHSIELGRLQASASSREGRSPVVSQMTPKEVTHG